MIHRIKILLKAQAGITLIELLIVITILSVMSLIVVPRIYTIFDSKRTNFLIITTMIAKTFDDSFVNEHLNFVLLHLYEPMSGKETEGIFSRLNGISVIVRNDNGEFIDNKNKLLQYKRFSDSFKIEEIILTTGEKITTGNVMIPFYPIGQSDNVILHILVNDEENWSVRIYKMRKEPDIFKGYITFKDEDEL